MNTNWKNENWQTGDFIIGLVHGFYIIRYITYIEDEGISSYTVKASFKQTSTTSRFINFLDLHESFRLLTNLEKIKYL